MIVILTVDEEEAFDSLIENGVDEDLAIAQIARIANLTEDLTIEVEEGSDESEDEPEDLVEEDIEEDIESGQTE